MYQFYADQAKPTYIKKMEKKKKFIRNLKLKATKAEIMMHGALLSSLRMYRVDVLFQHPVGPYIADFYLYPLDVVIEVDGGYHNTDEMKRSDRRRDTYMRNKGITVIRVTNEEVENNPVKAAWSIIAALGVLPLRSDPCKVTICPPGDATQECWTQA